MVKDSGERAILPPFTDEHSQLRETINRWVSEEIVPHVDEWEAAREFPRELYMRAGELGFLGLKYPTELGGQGGDYVHDAVWAEELAAAGASGGVGAGLGAHTGIATPPVYRFGTPDQHERFLRPAIRGERVAALGITEPGAGSDVASIRTMARPVDGGYVVNGSKTFITNGARADFLVCAVKTTEDGGHQGEANLCGEGGDVRPAPLTTACGPSVYWISGAQATWAGYVAVWPPPALNVVWVGSFAACSLSQRIFWSSVLASSNNRARCSGLRLVSIQGQSSAIAGMPPSRLRAGRARRQSQPASEGGSWVSVAWFSSSRSWAGETSRSGCVSRCGAVPSFLPTGAGCAARHRRAFRRAGWRCASRSRGRLTARSTSQQWRRRCSIPAPPRLTSPCRTSCGSAF